MEPRPLADLVDPGWASALAPVEDDVHRIGTWLRDETAAGRHWLPAGSDVLRAFTTPFDAVRVLVIGQDPYPTPGHPIGLSFAVDPAVRPVPRSLANIYRELSDDVGVTPPAHGDLRAWSDQGVLLLNRVLTVQAGEAGSHRGKGWEAVTDQAVRALVARGTPLVTVLWGAQAGSVRPLLGDTPVVASAHPSPLSASRGFFGSRPFSQVNALLESQGAPPVDWTLPAQ
ncbi:MULTISPECIES: uracil-DNA glycosylase [Curtobacterium]|uniref:Uracil-DNA glycosylase n=1 Tax=Curtobacterium poinsettiae TaxID=159612 RepID=A0ABT3RXD4_9MICO|nr:MULTISPECIES: uracil-DNA glycosylase [Curtobacterium]MBT1611191.1 uracil-DNA glycosylase [Curtobacterium flaccumfaciens pv. poinsettiae]MCX2847182.1 uracil-DNA glycosylase [Curtobacterium flaccumfaciens pv. poinsettiae]UXN17701.1 uracil-DNA glycosylase [Curtobacterium flaccumfaciens pv. poinsettiae]UXZ56454.1 uracil-DNA glycosylase [Curtobacterium sp. Arg-1]